MFTAVTKAQISISGFFSGDILRRIANALSFAPPSAPLAYPFADDAAAAVYDRRMIVRDTSTPR